MREKTLVIMGLLLGTGAATAVSVLPGMLPNSAVMASNAYEKSAATVKPRIRLVNKVSAQPAHTSAVSKPQPRKTVSKEAPLLAIVDQPDISLIHRRIANDVLLSFPEACRNALKNFYVRYDNPKQRGLGGPKTIIITGNVGDDEFRALLIHELGHVFDLNENPKCMGGTAKSGASEFMDGTTPIYLDDPSVQFYRISWSDAKTKKPTVQPGDFASGYASSDAFEDFAESFAYFVLQRSAFEERAQTNTVMAAKLKWFTTYLFPNDLKIATGFHEWSGVTPWDITKLTYQWKPATMTTAAVRP